MAEEDEEKTAFHTEYGTLCYEKMPFGLRNSRATYQRLVDKAFSNQIGRNIKIYVDDMTLYIDGASSSEGSGAGLILIDPDRKEITYALRFKFPESNNEAEYEALIAGLELAVKIEVRHLQVFSDSLLVTNHMKGTYEARDESMKQYLARVLRLQESFESFSITQIPHSRNKRADALSKLASSSFAHLTKMVLVEVIPCRSTEAATINVVTEMEVTWMNPIVDYLKDEAHFGSCEAHAGARTIAQKAARLGYYWPTMYQDATQVVSTCRNCQEHAPILRKPQYDMTSIYNPWPFYQWGIDIVGPFPEAPGRVKFLVIAIDYFTKWVEAAPLATITGKNILKFVWTNIVCHFGIPGIIISDNGKQFSKNPFRDWCTELNIKQQFTSVAHPQANGQTEVTNRILLQGLKTRLGKSKGQWVEELSNVLWAYRTTVKAGNNCTPFSLVYGSEAVLPPEIGIPTYRISSYDEGKNNEELRLNLELLEERKEMAALREAKYKHRTEQYYNQRVRHQPLKVGDYVLRKNEASRREGQKKLDPNWEGPYQIIEAKRPGTYVLADMHEKTIPRTWHASNLRKFYF
ncbi:reverse transcriptase domain-containing protein [Tanacetum coccineum]